MQKFGIWETGYKIPKIDCIKLQSQSNCNKQHWEGEGKHKKGKKKSVCFKCPYHSCIFVWDCRFITWMTVRSKKRKRKKRKKETRFLHVKFNTGRKNRFTSIADLEQTICKCHICLILLNFASWRRTKFAIILH